MTLYEGDLVEIVGPTGIDVQVWIGLRARVGARHLSENTQLIPEQPRPDGYELMPFYWRTENLQLVERQAYQIGDRVVLKTVQEHLDNVDMPPSMVGVVLTVTGWRGRLISVVGPDGEPHDGYLQDRFRVALPAATPEPTPEPTVFAVGDRVVLKTVQEFPDNVTMSDSMVGVVLTVTGGTSELPTVVGPGIDEHWYHRDRFKLLAPAARPFAVGDRVRIVRASFAEEAIGRSGTITRVHGEPVVLDGVAHPWDVELDSYGEYHVAEVELIEAATTPPSSPRFRRRDRVRIVQASEATQAIGRSGILVAILDEPILIGSIPHPYKVRLDGGRGRDWYASEISHS